MPLNLKEMTANEKLHTMELLWDDLCRNAPDFSSPAWHEDILQERERKLRDGQDQFVSWEQAKKNLRDSLLRR